jgi:hypothetical protein
LKSQKVYLASSSDVIVREEGDEGEALLFDPETERIKVLNRTGLLLWNWCDGAHTRADLVAGLVGEYPAVQRDVLQADVERFLLELAELGLLRQVEAA